MRRRRTTGTPRDDLDGSARREQSAALAKTMSPQEFYSHVGANLDSSHAVFKALWVRDEEPELWKDAPP